MGITCNWFAISRGTRISNQRNIDFVFDTDTPIQSPKVAPPIEHLEAKNFKQLAMNDSMARFVWFE